MEEKSPTLETTEENTSTVEVHRLVSRLKEAVHKKPLSQVESYVDSQSDEKDLSASVHSSNYQHDLKNRVDPSSIDTNKDISFEPAVLKEATSLKQLVRTLAEKLKISQETVELLQKQRVTTDPKIYETTILLQQKEEEIKVLQHSIKELEKLFASESASFLEKEKYLLEANKQLEEAQKNTLHQLEQRTKEKNEISNRLEQAFNLAKKSQEQSSHVHIETLHQEIVRLRQQLKDKNSKPFEVNSAPIQHELPPRAYPQEVAMKKALTVRALEEEVNSFRCERVALKREISHLSERLKREEKRAQENEKQILNYTQEIETLKRELHEALQLLETEKNIHVDLERSLGQKEASLSDIIQENTVLTEQKMTTERELSTLRDAYTELKEEHMHCLEEYRLKVAASETLSEENLSISGKLTEVEELLREKIEQFLLLEEQIETAHNEINQLTIELKALSDAKTDSEFTLKAALEDLDRTNNYKQDLETELTSLRKTCDEMKATLSDSEMLFHSSQHAQEYIRKAFEMLQRAHVKISKKSQEEGNISEISRKKALYDEEIKKQSQGNNPFSTIATTGSWSGNDRVDLESDHLFKSSSNSLLFEQKRKSETFQFDTHSESSSPNKSNHDLF